MTGRPTPFGLLAGVAQVRFGSVSVADWGAGHRAIAQPDAGWLAEVIASLEAHAGLLPRLNVTVNSTSAVRGEHVIVPHQLHSGPGAAAVPADVLIRLTPAVRLVLAAAAAPIGVGDLAAKLHAEAPSVPSEKVTAMLAGLVSRRLLITDLHAASTDVDPLGHLLCVLDDANAVDVGGLGELIGVLRQIRQQIVDHNTIVEVGDQAQARDGIAALMQPDARSLRHPLALDLRLDADVTLPRQVADEVARAGAVLARLSEYPYGTGSWRDYHRMFYERYGLGALVPVLELVDPDSGIGLPAGYPGTLIDPPRPAVTPRDELLLTLAQNAVLDGLPEIVLDDELVAALDAGPDPARLPSHLELAVRVNAATTKDLQLGRYTLELVQVSRNVGGLIGRFLSVLDPPAADEYTAAWADLPGPDADTLCVQTSFPPLDPATAHVTRARQTLPTVLSLAEHRPAGPGVLTVHDLAVGCDGRRMYLAVPEWGTRIEVSAMHSLNLRTHTPPLARFLIELTRSQCAQVTGVRWGAAATLPYRPRLRYGRTVLAPATWRLPATDLPVTDQSQGPDAQGFAELLAAWRQRRRMPAQVRLVVDDKRLLLDLTQPGHRELLHRHLQTSQIAVLTEVVDPAGTGWCGGRPHEVIVPLRATTPPRWPALPRPSSARVIRRGHGDIPGVSTMVYARLFGDLRRQDVLLAEHLPQLLAAFGTEPDWWFLRYRDADRLDPHLRLRIRLPHPDAFGSAVQRVSAWAERLHHAGLLREVQYPTSYSETGRWGSGPLLPAAERVFTTDSQAVLTQLQQARRPHRQALIAAHNVAIAAAYLGGTATGMRWLVEHLPATAPRSPVDRAVFDEAVRIANPNSGWAALRAASGGTAIVNRWQARDGALAAWRTEHRWPGPSTDGIDVDDTLRHFLHGHYIRAYGIDFDDEPVCLYLTRAAALAWTRRRAEDKP